MGMRAMFPLQRFVLQQLLDHRPKLVELLAAFLGSFACCAASESIATS
jgi:hypothetical protein